MKKIGALLICLGIYLLALVTAVLSALLLQDGHPLFVAFVADLVATVSIFLFSVVFDNSSIYDPYWSVAPPLIALYWLAAGGAPGGSPGGMQERLPARSIVALILVLLWASRLTFNWARGWSGIRHEDWRYRHFRERYQSLYWPVSFFGIHLFPTLIAFLGCLSLHPVMTVRAGSAGHFGLLDTLAAFVILAAIAIETTADRQLHAFRRRSSGSARVLDQGLWARCRHPNYLGEILFWWGLYIFCLAADPTRWWFIMGPVAITALFTGISVPMMDRHLLARKSGYAEYMQRVPALLPSLFGKKRPHFTKKR